MPAVAHPTSLGLADRLALILAGLRGVVAARMAAHRALAPLMMLLWARLHRAADRFAGLIAPSRPPAPRRRARSSGPPSRLPRSLAWLLRVAPEAAPYGTQLQALLADPAMAAMLAADPRAARIVRPLCRMLGVPAALPLHATTVTAIAGSARDEAIQERRMVPVAPGFLLSARNDEEHAPGCPLFAPG